MTEDATVLPVPNSGFPAASGPAPVVPVAAPPPRPGRSRRATGVAGQVVGIVGIVVSLALIVGVLYVRGRGTYASTREQVVSILDRLALIDRLAPGFDVPEGPVDALAGLDETARALDAQVTQLIDAGLAVQGVNASAAAIAAKAQQVEAGLDRIAAGIDAVAVRLGALRTEVSSIAGTVNTVITILCVALVLLLAYMALLHWILFRSGRGYARAPSAA